MIGPLKVTKHIMIPIVVKCVLVHTERILIFGLKVVLLFKSKQSIFTEGNTLTEHHDVRP